MTTFGSRETAIRFAQNLVDANLAACVNLIENVRSIYRWHNKTNEDQEIIAFGKTTEARFKEIKNKMKTIHPYELPELIGFKISDGLPEYLNWITTQTSVKR